MMGFHLYYSGMELKANCFNYSKATYLIENNVQLLMVLNLNGVWLRLVFHKDQFWDPPLSNLHKRFGKLNPFECSILC